MGSGRRYGLLVLGAALFFAAGAFLASTASQSGSVRTDEIELVDAQGRTRARFATGAHGEPGFALYDQDGNTRLTVGLGESGEPSVNFLSGQGGIVWRAAAPGELASPPGSESTQGVAAMTWKLQSPAFAPMQGIPSVHTCEGRDLSPPLSWESPPAGTASLALIVDDPDAPDPKAPRVTWVHWVLYNLPPETRGLAEGITSATLPEGALEGLNDWKRTGYGGPCPPIGRHRYFFKLYALDRRLDDLGPISKRGLEQAMEGHVLARAELVGTYQKTGR